MLFLYILLIWVVHLIKKNLFFFVMFFFILSYFIPAITANLSKNDVFDNKSETDFLVSSQELVLLYGEINFFISFPTEQVDSFNVSYSLPSSYKAQATIIVEIRNDSTADIISYDIVNDSLSNSIINFNVAASDYEDDPSIHFDFWVLVKNDEYNDLPNDVAIGDFPLWSEKWLESTKAVQSDSFLIRLKAKLLNRKCDNILCLADKIVKCTSAHKLRHILWGLTKFNPLNIDSYWTKYLDAKSSLIFGGSCTGRANLGTALFRANGIPARVIHVMPTWPGVVIDNDFWFDMHYISEYYLPSYDWLFAETTIGMTPFEQKYNIIFRINDIADENTAGNGGDYYGGCEQWFWTESKDIMILWNYVNSGSRSWMETNLSTDKTTADDVFNITYDVYEYFTKYYGVNLTAENQEHFNNAYSAQKNAVLCFKQKDIIGYNTNISYAYDEYQMILL